MKNNITFLSRTSMKSFIAVIALMLFGSNSAFSAPPPPTNDDPCSAAPLTVGATCNYQTFTNVDATETPTTLAPGNVTNWPYHPSSYYEQQVVFQSANYQDVWFSVVVPASGNLQIQIDPNTTIHRGIGLCAYTGTSCSSLAPFRTITVIDNVAPFEFPVLRIYPWDNLAGQTLWIRFWPFDLDGSGSFDICAIEPSISDQMVITPLTNMSLNYLVNQVFASAPCDSVFDAVYEGSAISAGYFENGSLIGFDKGFALSSGKVNNIRGNGMNVMSNDNIGTGGDPQLTSLGSDDGQDASVITFKYIPATDTLRFRYIFGSEEYSRFVTTGVNDVFGFFISGPNPAGGTYNSYNFGLVSSVPVSINTINNGQHRYESYGPCENCAYYRENFNGKIPVSWNGLTVILEAKVAVKPCSTYTLKVGIQDIKDAWYDCGLLFEAKSGLPPGTGSMLNFDHSGNQTDIVEEGCSYYMIFSRPDTLNMGDSLAFYPNVGGTASGGTDYTAIPNPIWFVPGQMTDTVYYDVHSDAIVETEYITLNINGGCLCTPTTVLDTIYLSDHHPTNPVITPDQTICLGDVPVSLSVSINPLINAASVSYAWSPVSGSLNTISVSPTTTTTYSVTISRACQSDTVLQTTITVLNPIVPIISTSDLTLCIGQSGVYSSTSVLSPNATASWTFTGGTPGTASGLGPHSVNWNASGNYNVTLEIDNEGCISDTSISVYVMPGPLNPQTTGNVSICENQSTTIGVTINPAIDPTSVTYSWSPTSGNTSSISVAPVVTTTYQVHITTPCEDTVLSIEVTVLPIIPANFTVSQTTICIGDTIQVAFSGTASAGMTLDWTFSNGLPNIASGVGPHSIHWNSSGAQNITLNINNQGCLSDSTAIVNVLTGPELIINTEDAHCGQSNGSAECVVVGGSSSSPVYKWNTDASTPSIGNLEADTYTVTVTNDVGCKSVGVAVIADIPSPEAEFTYSPHVVFMSNPIVHFYDQSFPNVIRWDWDFGDQSGVSIQQNPMYIFPQVGQYTIVLEVEDSWGCIDTVSHVLYVKDEMTLYIPNAFSPNGNGSNDSFGPAGTMIDDADFEFFIYDRWGKLLFLTTNINVRWDGTYEGHKVEPGVYSWVMKIREEGGLLQRYDGRVTIVK